MTSVLVHAAIAPLYVQPSLRSEQVSQLVLGETASVLDTSGDWRRVRGDHDEYEGWMHGGYLIDADLEGAERWRREANGWSLGATLRVSGRTVRLPLRARAAIDNGGVRLPDGRRAEVIEGAVHPVQAVTAAGRAQAPERWALEHFEGAPYEWGGVTPWGVDCSGLVQTTFAARGVPLPRDAALQVAAGDPVEMADARPGDLLFFRGDTTPRITHVAFAAEDESLIHSTVACGGVLAEPWRAGTRAASLHERLVAVRRLETR